MAERTGKYAKRTETLLEAYDFGKMNLTTVLWFPAQLKRDCSLGTAYKYIALLIIHTLTKHEPASWFGITAQMTLTEMSESSVVYQREAGSRSLSPSKL